MPEPYLYEDFALRRAMSSNLVGLCRHLRNQGLLSGLGEQMDALRALDQIPLRKRNLSNGPENQSGEKLREQEIFDEHFRKFWYVWESSEEFYRKPPGEEEEERAKIRVIDERQQKPTYLSINDWMNQESESEEVKEAAGYSPFEVDTERDFSQFGSEELQDVITLINEIANAWQPVSVAG